METKDKQIAKNEVRSIAERKRSSSITFSIPEELKKTFTKGKITFLTLRGNPKTKSHHKMDFAVKFIKKLKPSALYIVREEDHRKYGETPTFHFHALVKNAEKPKESWYRKGIHIHYLNVPKGTPVGYQGQYPAPDPKPDNRCVEERLVENSIELLKRDTAVVKLLTYFSKDQSFEGPKIVRPFIHYIFQIGKKSKNALDYTYKNHYIDI